MEEEISTERMIDGVSKLGYIWLILKEAEKPIDKRRKENE